MNPLTIAAGPVVLAPTDRFFLLEMEIDPGAPTAGQVELQLEEASPFPLTQVYEGFVVAPDGTRAIAFAAYRRRFAEAETADWAAAGAVVPTFLALLVPPPTAALVILHLHDDAVTAVAWDGKASLPVAVAARASGGDEAAAEVAAELRQRLGVPGAEIRRLQGPIGVGSDEEGEVVFRVDGQETARLGVAELARADIRDKSFLEERRRREAGERSWQRLFAAAALLLFLALAAEAAALAWGAWNTRRGAALAERAGEVRRIEAAGTMAARVEDLAARPERPLEWLALAAAARPRHVHFLRISSRGDRVLEIEAQTPNAAEVGAFEASLRTMAGVTAVEIRDLRTREGRATFMVRVSFGAGAARTGGAS